MYGLLGSGIMGGAAGAGPEVDRLWQKQRPMYAKLFDRLNPGGSDDLTDADKQALFRQGLLGLAAGMLQTGGQGTAGALGNGLQAGLLAMNGGRDAMSERAYRERVLRQGYGDPAGVREFEAMTEGLTDEQKRDARLVRLGIKGRASSAGMGFETWTDENGVPRPMRTDPRTGGVEVFYEESGGWVPIGGGGGGAPTGQIQIDPSLPQAVQDEIRRHVSAGQPLPSFIQPRVPAGLGRGRSKEAEAAAVAAAQERVRLGGLSQELPMRTGAAVDQAQRIGEVEQALLPGTLATQTADAITRARGVEQAKADADFQTGLGGTLAKADEAVRVIDQLYGHPGLGTITGWSGVINPMAYAPGTDAAGAKALADQVQGRVFLEAFESLKGGGQITEMEGRKAEQAMARLNRAQKTEDYQAALTELRTIIEQARGRAVRRGESLLPPRADYQNGGAIAPSTADRRRALLDKY